MIGTPEYQLAKFLDSIIKNYIPDSYMLHSANRFLNKINNFKFKADHKLVSFDVQSIFTNVPLDEAINITADYIYSKDNQIKYNPPSLKKEVFKKCFVWQTKKCFCTKTNYINNTMVSVWVLHSLRL